MGLECKARKTRNPWSNRQIGLGVQNETDQKLTEFCQEKAVVIANTLFQQYMWTSYDVHIYGHHQMVSAEIRLNIFFVAKDGEALYTQQKQDLELRCSAPYCKIQAQIEKSRENH